MCGTKWRQLTISSGANQPIKFLGGSNKRGTGSTNVAGHACSLSRIAVFDLKGALRYFHQQLLVWMGFVCLFTFCSYILPFFLDTVMIATKFM